MSRRGRALAIVLLCLNLPGLVAAVEGVSFYMKNRSDGFIRVDGLGRGYVLHVPPALDTARPVPLVISLHAAGLWGAAQRDISGWNAVADREGFVVAYPSAGTHASPGVWAPDAGRQLDRDEEFIARLIDTLVATRRVDPRRVYVNGLSNGGGFSFALSCDMPERIAAVGAVASAQTHPWGRCDRSAPVPVVIIHGERDPDVPFQGGKSWLAPMPFPNIPGFAERWARRNGCAPKPVDSALSPTVTRRSWRGCAHGADVVLYALREDDHVWPSGAALPEWLVGRDTRSLDASAVLWAFYREHDREHAP